MTRNNKHVSEVALANVINTGIQFGKLPGCIPLYLEVQACNAANYLYFHSWQELSPQQRSFLIAQYITQRAVENNVKDVEYRDAKARAKST